MINFSTLQGLTISEGVVTEIKDASGRVIWKKETFKPIIDMGVLTFTYSSFFKCYSASFRVDSLPENFTSANALMIGDNIIPMNHSIVNDIKGDGSHLVFQFKNYEHTGDPTSEGEYYMLVNVTDLTVAKTLTLKCLNDCGNQHIIIGVM